MPRRGGPCLELSRCHMAVYLFSPAVVEAAFSGGRAVVADETG